jgi:hypothetical protein
LGANQLHYRTVLHCQTHASSLIAVVGHWFDHCRVPLSPCLSWSDTKKGQRHPLGCRQHRSTPTRFELARAEPIGFQNQLLNHSDTVSHTHHRKENRKHITYPLPQPVRSCCCNKNGLNKKRCRRRQRRDLNSRGQSPVDFESTSLTTRTRCLYRAKEGKLLQLVRT